MSGRRRGFGSDNHAGALPEVLAAAGNSLTVSLAGAALTMLLALPLGLLAARAPGPLTTALDRLAYLAHALPGVVIGLSLIFFGINVAYPLYQTRWLLALAYATLFLPLAVGAVAGAAAQSPPGLEEVARSLGRGPLAVLRTVTLPLTLPGIAATLGFVFTAAWSELLFALMLISKAAKQTFPVGLLSFVGKFSVDFGQMMAAGVLALIPACLFFIFIQKYLVQGLTAGAVKG
jgi:iron(III) transport system permease protein